MSRHLRILNDLQRRYTAACAEEIRQVIIITGAYPEASTRVELIPFFEIRGGLPLTAPYSTDMDEEIMRHADSVLA
jgi:hypothetical protein